MRLYVLAAPPLPHNRWERERCCSASRRLRAALVPLLESPPHRHSPSGCSPEGEIIRGNFSNGKKQPQIWRQIKGCKDIPPPPHSPCPGGSLSALCSHPAARGPGLAVCWVFAVAPLGQPSPGPLRGPMQRRHPEVEQLCDAASSPRGCRTAQRCRRSDGTRRKPA